MSTERKTVKILSFIVLLFGILALVSGVKAFVTGSTGTSSLKLFEGILDLVFGMINIVIGVLGIRGANIPSKIGPFNVLCLVCAIAVAVCMVLAVVFLGSGALGFIAIIVLYLACLVAGNVFGRKVFNATQR